MPSVPLEEVLDRDSLRRLNEVRKEVWRGGAMGLVLGLAIGHVAFLASRKVPALRKMHSRNTRLAFVLCSGAFGSFLFSTVRGSNSIYFLSDVFQKGSPTAEVQTYESKRIAALQRDNAGDRGNG